LRLGVVLGSGGEATVGPAKARRGTIGTRPSSAAGQAAATVIVLRTAGTIVMSSRSTPRTRTAKAGTRSVVSEAWARRNVCDRAARAARSFLD
jgi:hypothetical protein